MEATTTPKLTWTGKSGAKYEMHLYPIGTTFKAEGGVYIFTFLGTDNYWKPVYIGESGDLNARVGAGLVNHEKWPEIKRCGATHICAMLVSGGSAARLTIEADLRSNYKTLCNDQ